MNELADRIRAEIFEAEKKAWQALAKYKFWMFGYYAARWVYLNRLDFHTHQKHDEVIQDGRIQTQGRRETTRAVSEGD